MPRWSQGDDAVREYMAYAAVYGRQSRGARKVASARPGGILGGPRARAAADWERLQGTSRDERVSAVRSAFDRRPIAALPPRPERIGPHSKLSDKKARRRAFYMGGDGKPPPRETHIFGRTILRRQARGYTPSDAVRTPRDLYSKRRIFQKRAYPRWYRSAMGWRDRPKPPWGSIARMRHRSKMRRAGREYKRRGTDVLFDRATYHGTGRDTRIPIFGVGKQAGTIPLRMAKWLGRRVYQPPKAGKTKMRGILGRMMNVGQKETSFGAMVAAGKTGGKHLARAAEGAPWSGGRFGVGRITRSALSKPQAWAGAAVGGGVFTGVLRGIFKEAPKLLQEDLEVAGMSGLAGPMVKEAVREAIGPGARRDLGAHGSMVFGMRRSRHGGYI